MEDSKISDFVSWTGASTDEARSYLEASFGDLQQAVQLYFDGSLASRPAPASTTTSGRTKTQGVREDKDGVIHIDSDDDDRDMTADDDDDVKVIGATPSNALVDNDAALAQRLQEEEYGGAAPLPSLGNANDVRDPDHDIYTTQRLVDSFDSFPSGGGDGDEIRRQVEDQIRRRQHASAGRPNPFNQRAGSVWDDDSPASSGAGPGTESATTRRLAELYRPPFDIISSLPWDAAREEGKESKKWILVNVQDLSSFQCQTLNRDIWKDQAIKELIKENFIFLQFSKDDPWARDYIQFYFRNHENINNYPHVAIVDPRTGEQVKLWPPSPFPKAEIFYNELAEFLDRYSLDASKKNPVVKVKAKSVNVDSLTEEEMLELALQNSLAPNGGESSRRADIIDPDSLTKSPVPKSRELPMGGLGAAADELARSPTPPAVEESAFARISSSNPHVEPAHDPATTTRIQFRHATGRIIRRFKTKERVERIYEWLKAEPMEGKEGIEFELKKMPQGADLMDSLEMTIEEAGLKQGTVMIEFLE